MKTSFLLTPELKGKYLPIAYRRDGELERWADQGRLIEQDPSKGMSKYIDKGWAKQADPFLKSLPITVGRACTLPWEITWAFYAIYYKS